MKWPNYPRYKPSGVEWIGDLPAHWTLPPVYLRYKVDLGKMLNEASISGAYLTPYLRNVDVQWNLINVCDLPEMDIGPWEIERYTVRRGDLLVCEGGEVGRTALVHESADGLGYQKALHRLRPLAASENPRFMAYMLYWAAYQGIFVAGGNPNTIHHLTGEKLRAYRFPAPPAPEQRAIADFLDRETAKIDTLVAKKRTLIERLKEKRTALISRTVTGGLPPDVARAAGLDPHPKLKPSGIDWLGDVPEHWITCAVWHLFYLGRGRVISHEDIAENPGEFPVYSSQTENDGILGYLGSFDFEGDYVTWTTDGANAGTVFRRFGRFNCTNVCGTMKPKSPKRMETRFCAYALGMATEEFVRHDINPKLMNNVMAKIRIGLPPPHEQSAIADYLDGEMAKSTVMVTKIETAIERLQEYRTALITAAVTGKIDVRSLALSSAPGTADTKRHAGHAA